MKPDTVYNYDLQLGFIFFNINFWTEVQSYGKLSYLRPSVLGAVVTPSGQSVNQSVYMKLVCQRAEL